MSQVSGINYHVKMSKTSTLKIFYILTEITNYFTFQQKLQTCKHIFYHANIFFMQLSTLFIANAKIKTHFQKIKIKAQLSAM